MTENRSPSEIARQAKAGREERQEREARERQHQAIALAMRKYGVEELEAALVVDIEHGKVSGDTTPGRDSPPG